LFIANYHRFGDAFTRIRIASETSVKIIVQAISNGFGLPVERLFWAIGVNALTDKCFFILKPLPCFVFV
jgi:hypothetical protein